MLSQPLAAPASPQLHIWPLSHSNSDKNTGQEIPITPSWRTLADILYASRIYE
ncbi:DUF7660 family protein [Cupriavidus pauculus]|uniref:DUF7660 family protein n=1 Tax=Cupriavidus pauculus TaxID=82633 RepID=UPI003F5C1CC8